MWNHMWAWDGSWGMGWGWFGLMHLLWWAIVIVGLAAVFRWAAASRPRERSRIDRPLEILRERYARGEIDKPEYDERLRHLGG